MTENNRRKINPINIKLPELRGDSQQKHKDRDLTDPPVLKKGHHKVVYKEEEKIDKFGKLVEIYEKTQAQFGHIYKQLLNINERQDAFNTVIMEQIQQSAGTNGTNGTTMSETGFVIKSLGAATGDLQARFRYFLVELPLSLGQKIDLQKLKRWLNRVFSETFSVAFQRYYKGEMTFEQTKIYCSSNILRNWVVLNDKVELSHSDLKVMEEEMSRLLRYMQLKYPLTETTEINKALQGAVQEVDNIGLLAHNYFASSQIVFQERESANYNDLIMQMLNDVFSRIDSKSQYQKGSNFMDFKGFMTTLFENIQEEEEVESAVAQEELPPGFFDFMTDRYVKAAKSNVKEVKSITGRSMKDSTKIRQQKQQYRAKVRQYTHYLIGRKVPESFQKYSKKEIETGHLIIKSPTVLRVLTKWAQELRSKFTTPDYYANLSDGIKCQSGTVHSLLFPMRRILDEEITHEQKQIQLFLKSMGRDNLDLQLKLLRKQLNRGSRPFDQLQLQQICGRYSIQVLNSFHSNLISYLNRLIHGLASVASRFYQRSHVGESSEWNSPPDLVTFTIGDLMRCKISSKQKQILRVYDQMRILSLNSPQKLKIIRVKNRLNKSTNDILVNIKFNNLITCQIQLAVKADVSKFIKCSNGFCHYMYQLQRSPFGVISELCNVWTALDRTAQSFKQTLEIEAARQIPIRSHKCSLVQSNPFQRPFICIICQVVYYNSNYLRNHIQCQSCKEVICAKCLLRQEDVNQLKNQYIPNKQLRSLCMGMVQRIQTSLELTDRDLPEFGACISIQRREPKVQTFRLVEHGNQGFILGREGGKLYEIQKVKTRAQMASFMRSYLIFALDPKTAVSFVKISLEQALQNFIIPKGLAAAYRKQRQSIVVGDNLANEVLQKALSSGYSEGRQKIRKMFLDSNKIKNIDFIAKSFKNLVLLQLSNNPIESLQGLNRLSYLKSLALNGCNLNGLPQVLFGMKSLEELRLSKNKLNKIDGIKQLQRLKLLDLSHNCFESLPSELGQCVGLVLLRLQNNVISYLPTQIQHLRQLRNLHLTSNQLQELPQEIQQLVSLQTLELKQNHLKELSTSVGRLLKLEKLDISANDLIDLPKNMGDLQSLIELDSSYNYKLSVLPESFSELTQLLQLDLGNCGFQSLGAQCSTLHSLLHLKLSNNHLSSLPKLDQLTNLLSLDISKNKLQSELIRQHFQKLLKLQSINLQDNGLKQLPNFFYCESLQRIQASRNEIVTIGGNEVQGLYTLSVLDLSHNKLEAIPEHIMTLPKLRQLNLSSNLLTSLTDDLMAVWPSLLKIDLSDNLFISIPNCLIKAHQVGQSRIASIDVSCNNIEELPRGLAKLQHLKVLKCKKNKFMRVTGELQKFMKEKKIQVDQKELLSQIEISPNRRAVGSRNREHRRMPQT